MTSQVKLCGVCGGVMRKSSRRVLSAPAGVVLILTRFVVDGWLRFFHEFLFCSVAGEIRLARSLLYWVNTNRVWGCVLFGVGEYLAMC